MHRGNRLVMALDPLEKDQLRKKMATRMGVFLEGSKTVSCVSGHVYDEPRPCELCQRTHAEELLVVKNRAGKKLILSVDCLKEMVRFHVTDVEDLSKWLEKIKTLRHEEAKRKEDDVKIRAEERSRLEKKVIVRKRVPAPAAS